MKISKGEFLEDLMNTIPTNTIIYKTLTGIGATSLMLGKSNTDQNVIVVVPNVPVIKGKCAHYNTRQKKPIQGVYEGITIDVIAEYLNSNIYPKKLITTPESYFKVKDAIEENDDLNLFSDFFLLFDECERLVQDVAYREKILMPMHDFFYFDKKALISATPIPLSDPRFEEQGFNELVLEPDFDYSKDLTLIESNNIELSLAKFMRDNPREHYFIFHNTTDSIAHLIRRLGHADNSAVFCARDSKDKLKANGFKKVSLDFIPFEEVNFLTSRFYSAVDIEHKKDPTIILLTDLLYAEHSTIDPLSEAIQIVGRFRNVGDFVPKKEIVHITNFHPRAIVNTKRQIISEIEKGVMIHAFLRPYLAGATTEVGVKSLKELLKRVEVAFCITPDGKVNHYLKDNRFFEESVKAFYLNARNLIDGYTATGHFNVNHQIEEYTFTDKDRIKLLRETRIKTVFETLTPVLIDLAALAETDPFSSTMQMDLLRKNHPKEIKMLDDIGLKRAKKLKFDVFAIRNEIRGKQIGREVSNFEFINYLHEHFEVGEIYVPSHIKKILYIGIRRFKLFKLRPSLDLFKVYYKLSSDRFPAGKNPNGKHQKGFMIEKRLVA